VDLHLPLHDHQTSTNSITPLSIPAVKWVRNPNGEFHSPTLGVIQDATTVCLCIEATVTVMDRMVVLPNPSLVAVMVGLVASKKSVTSRNSEKKSNNLI
jgi:hypothetical protein